MPIANQVFYTPTVLSSSGGASRVELYARWKSLNVNYPTARRRRPVGKLTLFGNGTWLTCVEAKYDAGVSTISSGGTWNEYLTASLFGSINHLPGDVGAVKTINRNTLRSQAKGGGVNLPLMIAEYGQTVDLMQGILSELRNIASMRTRAGRKLRLVDTKIRLRDGGLSEGASNKILAYNYGLAPLLSDLSFAGRATEQRAKRAEKLIYPTSWQTGVTTTDSYTTSGGGKVERRTKVSIRGSGLHLMSTNPILQAMSQLRLTNPLELAYERIPFSFVADWACNFGEVLSSLDNPLTMGSSFTLRQDSAVIQTLMATYKGGTHTYEIKSKTRNTPGSASSVAELVYDPSMGARRLLNALALTRQRLPQSLFQTRSR